MILKNSRIRIAAGHPYPFGATLTRSGALNFALVSFSAEAVTLCLFDRTTKKPLEEIPLSPTLNKTGAVWHVEVEGIKEPSNVAYAYRISSEENLILDPYAKAMATPVKWGEGKSYVPYGQVVIQDEFDWGGDKPPNIPMNDLIIYEMHVRSFTIHPSSKVSAPGTFLGVIEKIPHLLELGVNAVELMPIHEFNEGEYSSSHPKVKEKLYNVWGYSTVNFFSPMNRYTSSNTPGASIAEFKAMVKALHKNGIEVILDVVFNHTAEGGKTGPILSFKGLDEEIYYMMEHGDYLNFTGCGNTVNTNQSIVLELILSCLRYWVTEMHVDGFRFDLATIFSRDRFGHPLPITPIIRAMSEDPILASVKLIAEPWDAAGFYQVGTFAARSPRWSEWNDKYRDTIRRFVKGLGGIIGDFARRLSGSEDLYHERGPQASINFVTAHDGFTLADLVSYNMKHNIANGEDNKDGSNHNESWNCGVEGDTDDEEILLLRQRQLRNFHLALMVSQGTPMVLMGDEYGHTRHGNNNTWCQDNDLNWFLWDKLKEKPWDNFQRFYALLIHFRREHPILKRDSFLTDRDVDWHGITPFKVEWGNGHAFLAFTLKDHEKGDNLYVAFNAQHEEVEVELPDPGRGKKWYWVVNTANPSPTDIYERGSNVAVDSEIVAMQPYSAILLRMKDKIAYITLPPTQL